MSENELATKADLEQVKTQIIEFITNNFAKQECIIDKQWLITKEVLAMLKISSSGLQNLRVKGAIPFSKIGGKLYYNSKEIEKLLKLNASNNSN